MSRPYLIACGILLAFASYGNAKTFTNPILDFNSADPSAHRIGEWYYLTISMASETELTIFKSRTLSNFRNAETFVAYKAPEGWGNLWASEMHSIRGDLYIHFTMDEGVNGNHRMYTIKANDPNDPMAGWSDAIRMMPGDEWPYPAIDGTILQHGNGKLYYLWSSWGLGPFAIYIAEMEDPLTVKESKLELRRPLFDWEHNGGGVNEGAYFIYNRNVSYMIFSASSTWDPNYCLGLMSIPFDKDPMNPSHWNYGPNEPVFWRNDEEDVYTTGHAAFTTSPDGTETWMIYHATVNPTDINGHRIARIEKITWDEETGEPIFPRPSGYNTVQEAPSGEPEDD